MSILKPNEFLGWVLRSNAKPQSSGDFGDRAFVAWRHGSLGTIKWDFATGSGEAGDQVILKHIDRYNVHIVDTFFGLQKGTVLIGHISGPVISGPESHDTVGTIVELPGGRLKQFAVECAKNLLMRNIPSNNLACLEVIQERPATFRFKQFIKPQMKQAG